jgi:hypothetical protein
MASSGRLSFEQFRCLVFYADFTIVWKHFFWANYVVTCMPFFLLLEAKEWWEWWPWGNWNICLWLLCEELWDRSEVLWGNQTAQPTSPLRSDFFDCSFLAVTCFVLSLMMFPCLPAVLTCPVAMIYQVLEYPTKIFSCREVQAETPRKDVCFIWCEWHLYFRSITVGGFS